MTQRILHVYKYFRPRFTGEGVFLERLAPVFWRLRPDVEHEVLVTAIPAPETMPKLSGLAAVHYIAQSEAGASQAEIVRWLARHGDRYAVVHHHTHVDRTFLGALALKLRGRRIALSATLDDSLEGLLRTYRPLFRPLVRRLFGLIDRFIAISPKLHEENLRIAGPQKSDLVPMGIPMPPANPGACAAARAKLGLPPTAKVLVSVGGICPRKDQLFLVERLPELVARDPNLMLVLVGPVLDEAHQEAIERFVAEHGLQRHVVFAGRVEQPWDYYRAADLMVFASHEEGFGTVMIEAMAYGLPIVARWLPGVNDAFIEHGRSGYLFRQADEFQFQVSRLTSDPQLARRMGQAGREFVSARFRIEDIAARYLELYGFPAEAETRARPAA